MPANGTWEERGGWVLRALMAEFGLADFQAAGIVGNIGFESVGFTKLHEIGQAEGVGGYGWGQWTAARREKFLDWCDDHGLDWKSDQANYGYLVADLRGPYARTVTALKNTRTVDQAVFSFGQTFERPGGTTPEYLPGNAGRLTYAKRALGQSSPTYDRYKVAKALQTALGVTADGIWGPVSRAAYDKFNTGV